MAVDDIAKICADFYREEEIIAAKTLLEQVLTERLPKRQGDKLQQMPCNGGRLGTTTTTTTAGGVGRHMESTCLYAVTWIYLPTSRHAPTTNFACDQTR